MKLVLALLALTVCALSQQPSPTPPKAGKEPQQGRSSKSSKADSREDKPKNPQPPDLSVTPQPQVKSTQSGQDKRDESSGNWWTSDWWIVIFTGILTAVAVFQIILMYRQSGYMRDGLEETKKATGAAMLSAEAAKQNSDSFMNSERAWLILSDIRLVAAPHNWRNSVTFCIHNCGKTPAFITAVYVNFAPVPILPEPWDCGGIRHLIPEGAPVPPDTKTQTLEVYTQGHGLIEADEITAIEKGDLGLYFLGKVEYRDIYQRGHQTTWCLKYAPQNMIDRLGDFLYAGPPEANRCV